MVTTHADSALADVMAALDKRVEAVRAKDIDRLMSLYSPDIVYFDIIPPHQFIGAADVRRNFLRWFDEYQGGVRSTVCLQQIDGQWLITHEHISFPINPENWSAIVDTTP